MIGRTNTGGGSGGGNELVIISGATRPAKATRNMIWVNTGREVTSYVLSATQPQTPEAGMVWLLLSDSGDIKIDAIVGGDLVTIYPGEVKQYVNEAWVNVPGEFYNGTAWAELVILETPVLDANYPKDVTKTVIKGNTTEATFNVEIVKDGNPAEYTYQWYVDGVAVSGATSSSYTKSDLSATATYSVYCEVSNKSGTVTSREATLSVTQQYTPTLNTSLPADSSVTVIKGKTTSATFSVSVATNGVPNSYTYQWYKDGVAVSGETSSSYTVTGLANTATHSIYCAVTNAAGTVNSRTATLKVTQQYTPVLHSSYPANASVAFKTSVTSKVQISTAGSPASYTYQWYKNGSAVSGATSATYTFTPTAIGTTTVYCKVTNAAGTVTSRTATITATGVYLYNAGDECTALTGGWVTAKRTHRSDANTTTAGEASVVKDGNGTVTFTKTGLRGHIYYCQNKINLKNYNTIHFEGTMEGKNAGWVGFYVWTSLESYIRSNNAAKVEENCTNFDLDVSGLTGEYYIGFGIYSSNEKVVMKSLEMR